MRNITVYSLSPICSRCRVADALIEQISRATQASLTRKNILLSMGKLLWTRRKPPLVYVDGRLFSAGIVPDEKLLTRALEVSIA